jgi:hypothetical protein
MARTGRPRAELVLTEDKRAVLERYARGPRARGRSRCARGCWFAELTTRQPRRETHRTVRELNTDIRAWIDTWTEDPRPYVWVKTADPILDNLTQYLNRSNDSRHERP